MSKSVHVHITVTRCDLCDQPIPRTAEHVGYRDPDRTEKSGWVTCHRACYERVHQEAA